METTIIKNGFLIDGTGNPWFKGSLYIQDGKFSEVGSISSTSADIVLDATGLFVCPGFIDVHNHADWTLLVNPLAESLLRQGITTIAVGNCGNSAAPFNEEKKKAYLNLINPKEIGTELVIDWNTIDDYLHKLEEVGMLHNVAALVGHGTIRVAVMDDPLGSPSSTELEEMKAIVEEAMKVGAYGLSTGLSYLPGVAADTQEIIELCNVVAKYGGIWQAHIRDYGVKIHEAIEEAIEIGQKTGVTVLLNHLMYLLPPEIGGSKITVKEMLKMIEKARESGVDVLCDTCFSYEYTTLFLKGFLEMWLLKPLWILEGSSRDVLERLRDTTIREEFRQHLEKVASKTDFSKLVMSNVLSHPHLNLKSLSEIAEVMEKEPLDAFIQLMIDEGEDMFKLTAIIHFEDSDELMKHPTCMIEGDRPAFSDEGILGKIRTARANVKDLGTFPRIFNNQVRNKKILTLEEAVRKITSFPAQTLGLMNRGLLREGMWADVLAFDPNRFRERATLKEPLLWPEGVEWLLVNGEIVVEKDEITGKLPGKVLRASTYVQS